MFSKVNLFALKGISSKELFEDSTSVKQQYQIDVCLSCYSYSLFSNKLE